MDLSKLSDEELRRIELLCQEIQRSRRETVIAEKMSDLMQKYVGKYFLIGENLYYITAVKDVQSFEGVQIIQKGKSGEKPCYEVTAGIIDGLLDTRYSRTGEVLTVPPLERATVLTKEAAEKYLDLIFSEIKEDFSL